jgi:hypothetical protein
MPYAKVYVNGTYQDDTPTSKISLAPGFYNLTLTNPATSKTSTIQIEILSGQTRLVSSWP